jgi:hypothetical protein
VRKQTRNEQVSGSSPLVGSLISIDTPDTRKGRSLCDLPGASLHHPYITQAWTKSVQKLMARNGSRNVWETVVL